MALGPDHKTAPLGRYVVYIADDPEVKGVTIGVAVQFLRWVVAVGQGAVNAADALGLDPNIGIILTHVYDNSPASRAGLIQGDVILSINGDAIRSRQQALLLVAGLEPGDQVDIEGWRDGQRFRGTLIAGERPPRR